jgi:hypothetical protein
MSWVSRVALGIRSFRLLRSHPLVARGGDSFAPFRIHRERVAATTERQLGPSVKLRIPAPTGRLGLPPHIR